MSLRGAWRSNHHKEVIWMVDRLGKRGRQRDSSRVRVDVQYGVMRMLMVLRPRGGECAWCGGGVKGGRT